MREKLKVQKGNKRSDVTFSIDWASTVKAIGAFIFAIALFALLRSECTRKKWSSTSGTVLGTRIVVDHAVQTQAGGHLTWKAEYSVAYSASSRGYVIWADSGIRSESEDGVRLALPRSLPSCEVRYNPETPGESTADCRQGQTASKGVSE